MTVLALSLVILATAAGIGAGARSMIRLLPPAVAVRGLVFAAVMSAAASAFVAALVALGGLAQVRWLAALGHWSATELHRQAPLPTPVCLVIAAVVVLLFGRAVWYVAHYIREVISAEHLCRQLGDGADGLIVLDDDEPDAYSLQAVTGRIVVTRGLLVALPPDEQRVLLAHERSHLAHRHSLLVALTTAAAWINPLLLPCVGAVALGVERWADEDAAAAVTSRRLAARTVARTALLRPRPTAGTPALGATGGPAVARTHGLLAPPPRRRTLLSASLVVAALVAAGCAVAAAGTSESYLDQAQAAVATAAP